MMRLDCYADIDVFGQGWKIGLSGFPFGCRLNRMPQFRPTRFGTGRLSW